MDLMWPLIPPAFPDHALMPCWSLSLHKARPRFLKRLGRRFRVSLIQYIEFSCLKLQVVQERNLPSEAGKCEGFHSVLISQAAGKCISGFNTFCFKL